MRCGNGVACGVEEQAGGGSPPAEPSSAPAAAPLATCIDTITGNQ